MISLGLSFNISQQILGGSHTSRRPPGAPWGGPQVHQGHQSHGRHHHGRSSSCCDAGIQLKFLGHVSSRTWTTVLGGRTPTACRSWESATMRPKFCPVSRSLRKCSRNGAGTLAIRARRLDLRSPLTQKVHSLCISKVPRGCKIMFSKKNMMLRAGPWFSDNHSRTSKTVT